MTKRIATRFAACAAVIFLTAASAFAGEKQLMHCFAWTSVKEATPADWNAFFKASEDLPKRIKGLTKIWYGKLVASFGQFAIKVDDPTRKKMLAGETVTGEVTRTTRDWGMCMEMKDADALKAYDTDPYHKTWTEAYAKIRVEGTTTFNIIGQ